MNVVGLGVDVVDVERIERMIGDDRGFVERVFSPEEIALCDSSARPAECYAARWAAREACAKALGGIPDGRWRDIRVIRLDDGQRLLQRDADDLKRRVGDTSRHLAQQPRPPEDRAFPKRLRSRRL